MGKLATNKIALCVVLGLMVLALQGCGGGKESSEKVESEKNGENKKNEEEESEKVKEESEKEDSKKNEENKKNVEEEEPKTTPTTTTQRSKPLGTENLDFIMYRLDDNFERKKGSCKYVEGTEEGKEIQDATEACKDDGNCLGVQTDCRAHNIQICPKAEDGQDNEFTEQEGDAEVTSCVWLKKDKANVRLYDASTNMVTGNMMSNGVALAFAAVVTFTVIGAIVYSSRRRPAPEEETTTFLKAETGDCESCTE